MSMSKPGGSTMPGPEQIPPVDRDPEETLAAATRAVLWRLDTGRPTSEGIPLTPADTKRILDTLGLLDGGPSGGQYDPNGRRLRPHAMPKSRREDDR